MNKIFNIFKEWINHQNVDDKENDRQVHKASTNM